jgi:L-ascorbate metabolism protein UlaG (beta-lactamase superfamily)
MLGGGWIQRDLNAARQIRIRPNVADTRVTGHPVTWVGHATVLIRTPNRAVLVDPSWSTRLFGAGTRPTPPGVDLSALPPLAAVLLTHYHADHMDRPTLCRLRRDTTMLVRPGVGGWLRRRGVTDVREHDWCQTTDLGDLRCTLVPAHHWSGRNPFTLYQALWGGWVVHTEAHTIYHAGDTAYGPTFRRIRDRLGHVDLPCLPVGAYEPRWFQTSAHTDPAETAQAYQDLAATCMLPIHWSCWNLGRKPVLAPLRLTRQAWNAAALPAPRLWDLAIGESRDLASASALAVRP